MTAKKIEFTEHQIKHLQLIQDVITRMNSNSFQMKGWMAAIMSAILALYAILSVDRYTTLEELRTDVIR